MKVAVIGVGSVGGRLASRWHALGHEVSAGRRNLDAEAPHLDPRVPVLPAAAAVETAEVVVLAVPAAAVIATALALPLGERIVVDTTNAVRIPPPGNATSMFAAVVDALQQAHPTARPVKAFNTLGAETIDSPMIDGRRAWLPVAADDADAAATVVRLATELGYDAVHLGGVDRGAELEALARVWMALAMGPPRLGRHVALGLLRG